MIVNNKSGNDFSNLRAEVNSGPEVVVKVQSPPPSLQAGQEVAVLVAADCFKPFKEPVNVTLSFDAGYSEHSYTLRLPVLLSSFFEPVPSDRDTYMARWKMLENEVQEIFPTERSLDREFLLFVRNTVFPKLKIGLAADLDTSERTCTGSFSLQTGTTTADGKTVSVGGMLRLEADTNQKRFRVTIRSKHPVVSQAIRDILKEILA